MRRAQWMLLLSSVILTACAGAQPAAPSQPAPPVATVARQPITVHSPLSKAFGLTVGAQWVYETNRSDECVGRGVSKTARGAITETVASAWQLGDAQVFELRVESCLLGQRLETTEYDVVIGDRLYRAPTTPETLIARDGRGYETMLLTVWPVTDGQTFGGGNKGAWRVLDQAAVDWAGGRAESCAHVQRRSTNNEEEIWLCEGVGVVKHTIRQFGQRINEEQKSLIARAGPTAP